MNIKYFYGTDECKASDMLLWMGLIYDLIFEYYICFCDKMSAIKLVDSLLRNDEMVLKLCIG